VSLTGRNEQGKIIALGGIAFLPNGLKLAFSELTDEARNNPIALHKAGHRIVNWVKEHNFKQIVASYSEDQTPASIRWLKRFGFKLSEIGGIKLWILEIK